MLMFSFRKTKSCFFLKRWQKQKKNQCPDIIRWDYAEHWTKSKKSHLESKCMERILPRNRGTRKWTKHPRRDKSKAASDTWCHHAGHTKTKNLHLHQSENQLYQAMSETNSRWSQNGVIGWFEAVWQIYCATVCIAWLVSSTPASAEVSLCAAANAEPSSASRRAAAPSHSFSEAAGLTEAASKVSLCGDFMSIKTEPEGTLSPADVSWVTLVADLVVASLPEAPCSALST